MSDISNTSKMQLLHMTMKNCGKNATMCHNYNNILFISDNDQLSEDWY